MKEIARAASPHATKKQNCL